MAVFFRDRLAFAKAKLLEAPSDDKARVSSMLVRPLQTMLRELSPSLRMEDNVRLSVEIMEVALATTDVDLLFATLLPSGSLWMRMGVWGRAGESG